MILSASTSEPRATHKCVHNKFYIHTQIFTMEWNAAVEGLNVKESPSATQDETD